MRLNCGGSATDAKLANHEPGNDGRQVALPCTAPHCNKGSARPGPAHQKKRSSNSKPATPAATLNRARHRLRPSPRLGPWVSHSPCNPLHLHEVLGFSSTPFSSVPPNAQPSSATHCTALEVLGFPQPLLPLCSPPATPAPPAAKLNRARHGLSGSTQRSSGYLSPKPRGGRG